MKQKLKVPALLMCCLALSGASCEKRVQVPLPIPPERMDCQTISRPTVPPEYLIDWTKVQTVEQAHAEHDAFVTQLRKREGIVAVYIVQLEGSLFACADDASWLKDYTSRLSN